MRVAFRWLYGSSLREREYFNMSYARALRIAALRIAERTLIDGATLAELRQAAKDLRALSPNSALANLADAKIEAAKSWQGTSRIGSSGSL